MAVSLNGVSWCSGGWAAAVGADGLSRAGVAGEPSREGSGGAAVLSDGLAEEG